MAATIERHLSGFFGKGRVELHKFDGPIRPALPRFKVAVVRPKEAAGRWTYVSVGASVVHRADSEHLEFCLITSEESSGVAGLLLAMVANFHADLAVRPMCEGRVLNIGRPWQVGSGCDHLLVSLPYPFGPTFETVETTGVRILWLMPIHASEARFLEDHDVGDLEAMFEAEHIDYTDLRRGPVV